MTHIPEHNDTDNPNVGQQDAAALDCFRRKENLPRGRGAPEGSANAMTHGIYANRFLTPEERPLFDSFIGQLYKDFVFNKSSDFMQVELVAVYFLKLGRAQEAGDWEAAERLDRMIRCHLKDLKATKIAREGEAPKGADVSPADWATALLEKVSGVMVKKPAKAAEDEKPEEDGG